MRTSPLRAFAKQDKKTHSIQSDDPNKKMGYSQSMKKLEKKGMFKSEMKKLPKKEDKRTSMQDPDSGGFMHPPYKVQRDLAGNVKYYHGFKKKNKK